LLLFIFIVLAMDIFYILSKTIYILGMPITWLVILLVVALFSKGRKKNIIIGAIIVLTYTFSSSFIVNKLMLWWEQAPTPYSNISNAYDVGIILSGPVAHQKLPKDRVYINKGSDRFLHTADLYHKGLIKHILVTGGHQQAFGEMFNEADQIKEVLLLCNVPDSAITLEVEARNTRENALFSAKILQEHFPNQRYLVITSAFHMKRSLACFHKAYVQADGFSTDFYTYDSKEYRFTQFLPSAQTFNTFTVLVREMIGYVVYKLVGYA